MRIANCKSCGQRYIYVDREFVDTFILNNPLETTWIQSWYEWSEKGDQWAAQRQDSSWDCSSDGCFMCG